MVPYRLREPGVMPMSAGGIFLDVGDALRVLSQQPYEAESVLQRLLEQYPELIAGPRTLAGDGGRLLLISREMPLAADEGGGRTWSLDHLFVDTAGVPVFVEVKRSTDTRSRREVVAQMLDYAAHGVRYLPIQKLRDGLDRTAARQGQSDGAALLASAGIDNPDAFWQTVEANFAAGRIRMLFVADELPAELRRIIEFLNEQMHAAEVLGVEIRRFVADGHAAYVPTVFGQTSHAIDAKTGVTGQTWTEDTFLETAQTRTTAAELDLMRKLFAHIRQHHGELRWGRATGNPGTGGWYPTSDGCRPVWRLYAKERGGLFQFDLNRIRQSFGTDRPATIASHMDAVPAAKGRISGAFASIDLRDLAGDPGYEASLFSAIDAAIRQP